MAFSEEAIAAALVERFSLPYCFADQCLDPFPLWEVSGMAVSGDRIALAGPGALVPVYAGGGLGHPLGDPRRRAFGVTLAPRRS